MAVISKETSYSSTSTYYTLNSVSASHSGSTLTVSISLTIQGGSSTSLGSGDARVRYCYMYDGSGNLFNGTYTLKDSSTAWSKSFNKTWSITFTKNIGYSAWSSNCYLRIGPNTSWNTSPATNSFWWNGSKATNTGTVGQTFAVSVSATNIKPTVSAPANAAVNIGETASFKVTASNGVPASYTYQWQVSENGGKSYSNIYGSTYDTHSITATDKNYNGYLYRCAVSNSSGTTYSSAAALTVYYPMELNSAYPKDSKVIEGNTASFSVSISNEGNPAAYTYQWYKNNTAITNATAANYTTSALSTTDNNAEFYCIVKHTKTNTALTSRTAQLKVIAADPALAPTIIYPTNAAVSYRVKPYFLVQWNKNSQSEELTKYVEVNGVISTTSKIVDIDSNKSLIEIDGLTSEANTISVYSNNGYSDSQKVSRTIFVRALAFTDTLAAGVPIKAKHITEIRSIINNIELYYNLTYTAWKDVISAGKTPVKAQHFEELKDAVMRLVNFENTNHIINYSPIWKEYISKNYRIYAAHLNKIRGVIEQL